MRFNIPTVKVEAKKPPLLKRITQRVWVMLSIFMLPVFWFEDWRWGLPCNPREDLYYWARISFLPWEFTK